MWLHGEAVAAGTVMAADMSHRLGWIERDILDRTVRLLQRAKLPIAAPAVSLYSLVWSAVALPGTLAHVAQWQHSAPVGGRQAAAKTLH